MILSHCFYIKVTGTIASQQLLSLKIGEDYYWNNSQTSKDKLLMLNELLFLNNKYLKIGSYWWMFLWTPFAEVRRLDCVDTFIWASKK